MKKQKRNVKKMEVIDTFFFLRSYAPEKNLGKKKRGEEFLQKKKDTEI